MSSFLDFGRDINGFNAFAPVFSNLGYGAQLAQNTAQSLTIPAIAGLQQGKYYIAVFSYEPGTTVFVANNDTAAAFSGTMGASTSDLLPTSRTVLPGDVLSFLTTDTTAYVGIKLYVTS